MAMFNIVAFESPPIGGYSGYEYQTYNFPEPNHDVYFISESGFLYKEEGEYKIPMFGISEVVSLFNPDHEFQFRIECGRLVGEIVRGKSDFVENVFIADDGKRMPLIYP